MSSVSGIAVHPAPAVLRPDLLRDERLAEIFATTVARTPDATALVFADQRLSYAELDRRANRIANGLRARGIGRGAFVGLWLSRSADLHVALLGILKAGAAYIPFDFDAPPERVAACMADCAGRAIIVDGATIARADGLSAPVLPVGRLLSENASEEAPPPRADGASADDAAYAIYTSGSTGKPKAVVISHRNICHYLRAANEVYGVTATDVAFQGASVAFDLSLEEIFIPYMVGATLWVASRETLQQADALCDVLEAAGITVLDTVPTLLTLLPRDVASLRVIILGGEACPPSVVERWCRSGRRVFNSYGPTEATVVATVAELTPGGKVTIGKPLPNYTAYVVDEALQPVAPGTEGELLIGGPGIAAGYLGRPELTAEKFIRNPFNASGGDPVLYRSGDAVVMDADGNLEFHGRIDDQVKIRGFRVELGEIEAKLSACDGVAQPAVVLRRDDGIDRLVAFIVAAPGAELDVVGWRERLRAELPSYMVPARFELIDALPRLVSGKVDRKTLMARPLAEMEAEETDEPRNATEAALLAAARSVFPGQAIPLDGDFFLDLGGHSLLAARFVSVVRQNPAQSALTLQDIYAVRSLRAMAALLDSRAPRGTAAAGLGFEPVPLLRRALCGLAQAAVLPLILGLATAPWLGVFVSYMLLSGEDATLLIELVYLLATYCVINLGTVVVAIAGKWLVLGRAKPGRYPLWGVYYYRWWLAQRLLTLVHMKWFQDTPVMRWLLRLLGARIGHDALIGELEIGALDLVTIGDGATIGSRSHLANAEVIGNELVIGRVTIGALAMVGTSSVIGHDTVIGEGAELGDLTAVPAGTTIGAWEAWDGSPARKVGTIDPAAQPAPPPTSTLRRVTLGVLYVLALVGLPPITLMPIFPAFYVFDRLADTFEATWGFGYLKVLPLLAWPTAMALVVITVGLIAAIRWMVLPSVKPGVYSVHSGFYFRKWVVALCTELTLETLSSLYATVYMRAWYRLMGAKIGKGSEISTNLSGRYDLIDIGEKCFIADEVVLGDETVRRGWMMLEPVHTGDRVFVGNEAVVPPGTDIPTDSLIGIKSKPPSNAEMVGGGIWFGSPPIKLPVRQQFANVASNWTYEPSRWRQFGRAVFEAFSVSLPTMLFITFGTLAVEVLAPAILAKDYAAVLPQFLGASVAISFALMLSSVAVKWLTMGRYEPTMKPMWSWWALRTEAVAVMYWGMAGKVLLDHLRGTPFLPWALRLYGVKTGQGIYMDTTDITEFDCVTIGDHTVINGTAALQTHLYEDRLMKVGRVAVGKGVSIGCTATVLYDTHIGDFAQIGPLTIVMKGEDLPPHTAWHGAPAVEQDAPHTAPALVAEAVGGAVPVAA
ncbi:MAG: Pls/PosA family non-ribosomal peptide synthetase [Bacteroidota bacterium]